MKNLSVRIINKIRVFKKFIVIFREWHRVGTTIKSNNKPFKSKRILIFPSDLKTITGALGDDAMISASIQQYSEVYPELEVNVLCRNSALDIVTKKGYQPVVLPWIDLKFFPQFISSHL